MILTLGLMCFLLGFAASIFLDNFPQRIRSQTSQILRLVNLKTPGPLLDNATEKLLPRSAEAHTIDNDDSQSKLYTKEEIESQFETHKWQRLAYEDFKAKILARGAGLKTFPCVYATMGYRADEHRYVFLQSDNPAEPRNVRIIGAALKTYLSMARRLGSNTSLVIVGKSSVTDKTVEEYNHTFWDMLRGLRIFDPVPWPTGIPSKIETEKWTFVFNGEPIFPVMLSPAHARRWSRHMSTPVVALQPKWVLDRLLATPEKREAAQQKVRKLLAQYDEVEVSPDLTSYGVPGTTEARQLCLLDENQTASCPYKNLDEM